MSMNESGSRPRPESWAAVALLQGVVDSSDAKAWEGILAYRGVLEDYFGRIGLVLEVHEDDEPAYLRQRTDEERDRDGDTLPRLFRRSPLTYEATLLCLLLRDELRRFENEDLDNTRCTVTIERLSPMWKSMQPATADDVKLRDSLVATFRKLESMAIVAKFGGEDEYEIKPILKARLPLDKLTEIRDQMKKFAETAS